MLRLGIKAYRLCVRGSKWAAATLRERKIRAQNKWIESDDEIEYVEEGEEEELSEDDEIVSPDAAPEVDIWGSIGKQVQKEVIEEVIDRGSEWDELPTMEDVKFFNDAVKKLHPSYIPASDITPEAEIIEAVKKMKNPRTKFNAQLSFGEGARRARGGGAHGAAELMPKLVDVGLRSNHQTRMVVVTGHKDYRKGNLGINGIYELYPESYDGRPVYQKSIEKRWVKEDRVFKDGTLAKDPNDYKKRAWQPLNVDQRILLRKFQGNTTCPAPTGVVHKKLLPSKNDWFLFWDDRRGCWCIGPAVGACEVYAKCPGVEDAVPTILRRWMMFDYATKEWYENDSLVVQKCGN
eukprot:TRINITY_DN26243_c0_g1_i1.p1 TRINITY_DN26243_c0_g1~~TRINITY_DN26243_c0_g1_i1.p1  ORF type:complete len:349 (-),score=58.15 TRINITY_DN26243_c0_g1_i1:182-1228(-)